MIVWLVLVKAQVRVDIHTYMYIQHVWSKVVPPLTRPVTSEHTCTAPVELYALPEHGVPLIVHAYSFFFLPRSSSC